MINFINLPENVIRYTLTTLMLLNIRGVPK
jgi:hypothetical protein